MQHTATHCNTLQHTATHCNTLQHTATHCQCRWWMRVRKLVPPRCECSHSCVRERSSSSSTAQHSDLITCACCIDVFTHLSVYRKQFEYVCLSLDYLSIHQFTYPSVHLSICLVFLFFFNGWSVCGCVHACVCTCVSVWVAECMCLSLAAHASICIDSEYKYTHTYIYGYIYMHESSMDHHDSCIRFMHQSV